MVYLTHRTNRLAMGVMVFNAFIVVVSVVLLDTGLVLILETLFQY